MTLKTRKAVNKALEDPKTLRALKGSITKWNKIVKSTKAEDKGTANCPLCKLFY